APIIAGPGSARGSAPWMKWAALAGALATVSLAIALAMQLSRKPTVIVVPPAPGAGDDGRKAPDRPITINEPGPSPTAAPVTGQASSDKRPAPKRPQQSGRAAVTVKPPSETLSANQRNLASLYREDSEHGTPHEAPAVERGAHGGAGQVSQSAI